MSLRFIDGADHYATAQGPAKWTTWANSPTVVSSPVRVGGGALRLNNMQTVAVTLDSQPTWIVGFAFRLGNRPGTYMLQLKDGATVHLQVWVGGDGAVYVGRGGYTPVLGQSSGVVVPLNVWQYLEVKATISDTTGLLVVRLNEQVVINQSNIDTRNGANASANTIQIGGGGSLDLYVDDIYVCDGQGTTSNDFLGDVKVTTLLPNGNGTSSQFVGSDGNSTDNYLLVDDATPNDDTDYVSSSTVNAQDSYALQDLSSGTVKGVQLCLYARKDDTGARSLGPLLRSGGTDYAGAGQPLNLSYSYLRALYDADPATSAAWTLAGVNALEAGMRVSA